MQTDIIGVTIGVLGILIGLGASYYFYIKSIRTKKPQWTMSINTLIQDYSSTFDKLRVTYGRKKVENLSVTKVLFWNQGVDTIQFDDIKTANPLRVQADDGVTILDAKVLSENNTSSAFDLKLSDDGKYVFISFDYVDKDQGAVFQIIHTGKKLSDVFLVGSIKGATEIEFKTYRSGRFVERVGDAMFGLMALLYLPLLIYSSVFELFFSDQPRISPTFNWIMLIVGLVGCVFIPWTLISQSRRTAKYPKEFRNILQQK